jgi:DNA-binding response OmpR family regulator
MSKVLVAEDDNDIRDLIAISLSFAGHDVVRAADGRQAIELAVAEKPALILLDVAMPHLTGYEVLERLKEMRELAEVPVVFLSAKGQEAEIETGLGLGARRYILKPFDPEELVAQVETILADGASVVASDPLPGRATPTGSTSVISRSECDEAIPDDVISRSECDSLS